MLLRRYLAVLLLAAFVLASCSATGELQKSTSLQITTAGIEPLAPRDTPAGQNGKRLLRVHEKPVAGNSNLHEEERAFGLSKLKNVFKSQDPAKLEKIAKKKQYRQWLKDGEDPKTMYAKLGLTGKGPAAALKNDPQFHDYLAFSALWRRKKGALAKEWWQVWRKNAW
jgi:hypothetical protein